MKYFLIALLILGIYLNRSYAYFYDYQGDHFIGNPNYPTTHFFQTSSDPESKTLVILGDSLMSGTGSTREENSMAYLIAPGLAQGQNIELHNFARPGVGVKDVLERQVEEVSKLKPDYVVLMIGINDVNEWVSTSKFKNDYSQIIERLEMTGARITLINVPFLGSNKILLPPWNVIYNYRIGSFNAQINETASENNLQVLNLHDKFYKDFINSSDLYAEDQFHPSDKGYALWAEFINSQLNK